MNTTEQLFRDHEKRDEDRFSAIGDQLNKILDNHLTHMEPDIATIKEAMKWQEKVLLGIVFGIGTIVTGVIVALFSHTF